MKNAARHIPWILLAVLFASFPVIGKTIDDLRRSTLVTFRERATITGPYRGEERIPERALAAIHLLRAQGAQAYAVSESVRNTYDYQRITEGAWPIRLAHEAPVRIFLTDEKLPRTCAEKGRRNGMVLALCR